MTVFPMMARVLMALGCMWLCSHMPGKKAAVALAAPIDRVTLVPGPRLWAWTGRAAGLACDHDLAGALHLRARLHAVARPPPPRRLRGAAVGDHLDDAHDDVSPAHVQDEDGAPGGERDPALRIPGLRAAHGASARWNASGILTTLRVA